MSLHQKLDLIISKKNFMDIIIFHTKFKKKILFPVINFYNII